jgi:hypothetical protein
VLVDLQQELVEGKTMPLSLTFEKAGTVEIEVLVTTGGRGRAPWAQIGPGGRRWPVGEHASVAIRPGAVQSVKSGSGY